jgi:cystathionine beta-lyase
MSFAAALAAYEHGDPWLAELIAYLERNRDVLAEIVERELPELEMTPVEGTYLAWLDCRNAIEGDPHEFFLREGRIAVNDGAAFGPGGKGFVRLNFACPRSTLEEGLRRLRTALSKR